MSCWQTTQTLPGAVDACSCSSSTHACSDRTMVTGHALFNTTDCWWLVVKAASTCLYRLWLNLTNGLREVVGLLNQVLGCPAQLALVGVVKAQPGLIGTGLAAVLDLCQPLLHPRLRLSQLLQVNIAFASAQTWSFYTFKGTRCYCLLLLPRTVTKGRQQTSYRQGV